MARHILLTLAALLACGGASRAFAHAGAELTGVDADQPDMLETGFGVLVAEGESWDWICHETVTSPDALLTPGYARSPSGAWLATVPSLAQTRDPTESVYRSADGCDWDPVTGLTGRVVSIALFLDDDEVVAATAGLDVSDRNGLARSTDGGLTWTVTQELEGVRLITGLARHERTVWAASFTPDDAAAGQVHRSSDGGETWTTLPLDLSEWADETPLSVKVLAADDDGAWVGVGVRTGHVLLRTSADGSTSTQVLEATSSLVDGAVAADGGVWMLEAGQAAWHAADGETFAPVQGAPPAIGLGTDGADALLATSAVFAGGLSFRVSPDGSSELRVDARNIRQPYPCPAGSDVAEVCEPLWALVQLPGDVETDETDDTDSEEPGCGGCQSTGAGALVLAWLPLLWLRRRR